MILWADGFDHYGGDRLNMLDGVFSEVPSGFEPKPDGTTISGVVVPARTGDYFQGGGGNDMHWRRTLGDNYRISGFGCGLFIPQLPTGGSGTSPQCSLIEFRDADNRVQVTVSMDTTGALVVFNKEAGDGGTVLYAGSEPALVAGAWQHLEARVDCDAASGAVEVRVNGVTKVNVTGVNTRPYTAAVAGAGRVSQLSAQTNNNGCPGFCQDDIFAWVDTGDSNDPNNDFIGDRKAVLTYEDADTAQADFLLSTGSDGFALIDDSKSDSDGTVDDDSGYLYTAAVGTSEFTLKNLPANAAVITALCVYTRAKKTDAGACNLKVDLLSGSDVSDGTDRPITTTYTYYQDVHELNPTTGAPWTPGEVNAAKLRLGRTA